MMQQSVLITGASQGIGKAIAEQFLQQGAEVFICARNQQKLEAIAAQWDTQKVHYFACDLSKKEEVISLSDQVKIHLPHINVLINNAGIYVPGQVQKDDGALEKMMAVNFYSAFYLTSALMPLLRQNKPAHIFNMCSIAALQAYPNGGAYSLSKYALRGYTQNLREELKHEGIKVTGIYPGATYSHSWAGSGVDENRIMKASDIATMIYAATQLSPQAVVEDIIIRPQLGDL